MPCIKNTLLKSEGKPSIEQATQDKLDKAILFHKALQTI